jgi:hypothetical protein
MGDDKSVLHYPTEALFPMPNVDDITAHLLGQDVV